MHTNAVDESTNGAHDRSIEVTEVSPEVTDVWCPRRRQREEGYKGHRGRKILKQPSKASPLVSLPEYIRNKSTPSPICLFVRWRPRLVSNRYQSSRATTHRQIPGIGRAMGMTNLGSSFPDARSLASRPDSSNALLISRTLPIGVLTQGHQVRPMRQSSFPSRKS